MSPYARTILALWREIANLLIHEGSANRVELTTLCSLEEQLAAERGICLEVGTCRS